MNVTGGSDLARMQTLQRQAITTRNGLDRAATELTTGQKSNRFEATGGNLTRLFALERALERNTVFSENVALTELRLDVMQESFGRILKPAETLAIDLSTAVAAGDAGAAKIHARATRDAFADTIAALNTTVAGQSLFAGTASNTAATAPAQTILAELDALAAGAANGADAVAAINEYFRRDPAPSGAFFTNGYIGSPDDLSPVEIGDGARINYAVRADREELVAVLRAEAMAAVVAGGAFAGNQAEQFVLLREAGTQLLVAKEGMLDLRAEIGGSQFRVETARAERISERDTFDIARGKIVAVDPLEAASTYQTLQVQLESIYTITARLSTLRFTNFMR